MNYIYNIVLNFNKKYYDYYEWNKKDKITKIKKIPIFKTSTKNLKTITENKIKFDNKFIEKIHNKTETHERKKIKHAFLISDGKMTIAIKIKNKQNYKFSSLQIDENIKITKIISNKKQDEIKYIIVKKIEIEKYKTRFEQENEKYLNEELNKETNKKKISYIYLECFGTLENDSKKAKEKIKKEIIKGNDNFYKIFDILKITNQK